jgi:Tfp pilus assembly protein PilO
VAHIQQLEVQALGDWQLQCRVNFCVLQVDERNRAFHLPSN